MGDYTSTNWAGSPSFGQTGGGLFDSISGAQWLSAGSSLLGSALHPATAGASQAVLRQDQTFDNSGWSVNFGSGAIDTTRSQATSQSPLPADTTNLIVLAIIGVVVWKMLHKS